MWQGTLSVMICPTRNGSSSGVDQWSFSERFDGWALYGPGIVSSKTIADPSNLRIPRKLNGKTVQDSNTKYMAFEVAKTVVLVPGHNAIAGSFDLNVKRYVQCNTTEYGLLSVRARVPLCKQFFSYGPPYYNIPRMTSHSNIAT